MKPFIAILILLTSGAVAQVAAPKPAAPATQPAKAAGTPADQLMTEALAELNNIPEAKESDIRTWGKWFATSTIAMSDVALGHLDAANEVAKTIHDTGTENMVFLDMAVMLARQGKYAQAKATAHWSFLIPTKPDLRLYSTIARDQARHGDLTGAKATISEIKEDRYRDASWDYVAMGSCEGGHVDAAIEVIALIHNPRHKIEPLCSLAIAQLQAGDLAGARQSCQSAKTAWSKCEEADRDRYVAPIAHAMARVVGLSEARAMVDAALKPDSRNMEYAEIVRGMVENGNLKDAGALADEINGAARGMDKAPGTAYQSIAAAQIKAHDFSAARITAARTDVPPDKAFPGSMLYTRSTLVSVHAEILADIADGELTAGKTAGAVKDLAAALESLKSNKAISATAYGKVAALQIRAGKTAEAFATIKNSSTDAEERCSAYAYAARNFAPDPEANRNTAGPISK